MYRCPEKGSTRLDYRRDGDYLITDESSLFDFTGVDEMEQKDIQQKIREVYNVDVSDLISGNLLEIFARLHYRRYGGPS